jgi:OOP family OmpA-OmpF porin
MRTAPWLLVTTLALALGSAAHADPIFELDGNSLKLPAPITFKKAGGAELAPASAAALDHVKAYLDAKSYISTMRIEGHTPAGEGAQRLSEQRALVVARALVSRGVDCRRLIAVGFGPDKPIADPKTPEGRAQNERIMFVNAGLRGRPIGGMPIDGGGAVAGDPCK